MLNFTLCFRKWRNVARCTYRHSCLSVPQSWPNSICSIHSHWRTIRLNGSRKPIHNNSSYFIIMARRSARFAHRWWSLLVSCCVVVDSGPWGGHLWRRLVDRRRRTVTGCWNTFAGRVLRGVSVGKTQEENCKSLSERSTEKRDFAAGLEFSVVCLRLTIMKDDDDWASPHTFAGKSACPSTVSRHLKFEDTLSLSWREGLGRPKEFSGKEEDFQQWSKKTGGVLCWCDQGVWDDVGVCRWTADGNHDDSNLISSSCRRTRTRTAECKTWSLCCSRCTQHSVALTSYEANDIVARLLEVSVGGMAKAAETVSFGRCSLLELQAEIERWESYVSRCEEELQDTSDDEIKLAGIGAWRTGALTLDTELESLANIRGCGTWKSLRMWRRSLVWASVIPSQVNRGISRTLWSHRCYNQFSWHLGTGKGSSSPRDGLLQVRWSSFSKRLQCFTWPHAKAMAREANRARSWPNSAGKGQSKEGKGERTIQMIQRCQRFVQGKTSKIVLSCLESP